MARRVQAEFVCRHYCAALRHCNAMDMDDFVPTACALLEASAELRDKVQAQHTHIIVDEFQACTQCFANYPFTCQFDWLSDQLCQLLDRLSDHFAKHCLKA